MPNEQRILVPVSVACKCVYIITTEMCKHDVFNVW